MDRLKRILARLDEKAASDEEIEKSIAKEIRGTFKVALVEVKIDKRGPGGRATWITVRANNIAVKSRHFETILTIVKKHFPGKKFTTGRWGEIVGPWIIFDWIVK